MIQETLLVLLIVLILWPRPVLRAARWVMRHALGGASADEESPDADEASEVSRE